MIIPSKFRYSYQRLVLVLLITAGPGNIRAVSIRTSCGEDMWDCDNGECIDLDLLCDGLAHCADRSDEIAENCIHEMCPSYSFRCTYGACIAGQLRCNGETNCADNSDELPAICNPNQTQEWLQGNCSEADSMQCQSGGCIDADAKCDGRRDCPDGSDEVVELCSNVYCPSYAFRCGYGACVPGSARCNGRIDCADGSDEAAKLCDKPRRRPTPPLRPVATPAPAPTVTTTRRVLPDQPSGYCQIPTDRASLIITNLNDISNRPRPGDYVSRNTILSFACERDHVLIGKDKTYCAGQTFFNELPTCTKYCRSSVVTRGVSTMVLCYYRDQSSHCQDTILPGTEVRVSCAPSYRKPLPIERNFISTLRCGEDGEWDFEKTPCEMQCGQLAPKVTKFSKGGVNVNITEAPWHVPIYSRFDLQRWEHVCGGSIISPRLVISAAHCFWNAATSELFDKSFFQVAAGKYFRDYYTTDEYFPVQHSNLSSILLSDYNHDNFYNDLALVVLERPLRFTSSIRPICIEFFERAEKQVGTGLVGSFAGWGIGDNSRPADVLQRVSMTTLSYTACERKLSETTNNNYKLQDDKFCIASTSGGNACRGDSGGGFVMKIQHGRLTYYRLMGIVSHAPVRWQDCSFDSVVSITSIQYFEPFIKRHYNADLARESRPDEGS